MRTFFNQLRRTCVGTFALGCLEVAAAAAVLGGAVGCGLISWVRLLFDEKPSPSRDRYDTRRRWVRLCGPLAAGGSRLGTCPSA